MRTIQPKILEIPGAVLNEKWGQVHNLSCENDENENSFSYQRLST